VFTAAQLEAAHARLRGQIVHTPLIGGLSLPGFAVPAELRVKPDVLQPAGSIHVRGALHCLQRALGRDKGVVVAGSERAVLAGAWAGAQHRLPVVACLAAPPAPAVARLLELTGCEIAVGSTAEASARARGFRVLPGLAADLPADCADVVIAPAALRAPLAAACAALGRPLRVHGCEARPSAEALRTALAVGLRVLVGPASASALECALEAGLDGPCVVLSE
jgi:hypothetical protein